MNLQFDDISDRAVRVSWSPPKKSNGVLIGYKLKYQIKENPETFKEEILPPNVTSVRVEHLQVKIIPTITECPIKNYKFRPFSNREILLHCICRYTEDDIIKETFNFKLSQYIIK